MNHDPSDPNRRQLRSSFRLLWNSSMRFTQFAESAEQKKSTKLKGGASCFLWPMRREHVRGHSTSVSTVFKVYVDNMTSSTR